MTINRLFGSILIITGTCIGAGMLALPIVIGAFGFWLGALLFLAVWLYLMFTALLMAEVNLWLPENSNIISMASATLGHGGKAVAWLTYLLLLYALLSAYTIGIGDLLSSTLNHLFGVELSEFSSAFIVAVFVGAFIYIGTHIVDGVNRLLMLGLLITFVSLALILAPQLNAAQLQASYNSAVWLALPVVVTSFGYHIVIPGLRTYLSSDVKKIRLAIIIGGSIPLLIYLLWIALVLGILPYYGAHGIAAIAEQGHTVSALTTALNQTVDSSWITSGFGYFAFFAVMTSFLGVAYSLFDFLADGFSIKKNHSGKILLAALTFIPPFYLSWKFPNFTNMLAYAGIFVAILLGILPALMAWRGRASQRFNSAYQVPGGKITLSAAIIFSLVVIYIQL